MKKVIILDFWGTLVETGAVLALLPGSSRRLTLVAAGSLPPPSLLDRLASDLDRLVLVPDNRLAALPRHLPRLRARHAARDRRSR